MDKVVWCSGRAARISVVRHIWCIVLIVFSAAMAAPPWLIRFILHVAEKSIHEDDDDDSAGADDDCLC
jgi:hypothetical protein